jgi:hypothetical protein
MELVVTGLAFQVGELVGLDVQDRVAHRTGLDALELLVDVFLPQ